MDSAKEAELEASQVILPSLLANLRQPPIDWVCLPQFQSLYAVWAMTGKESWLQPTMAWRSEREEEEIFVAASQQLIFACKEDAARGKAAQVERGTGASDGRSSAPVSTATVRKVSKLGVPKKTAAQTGWAGNVGAEWAKAAINKRLNCLIAALPIQAQTISRQANLCSTFSTQLSVYLLLTALWSKCKHSDLFFKNRDLPHRDLQSGY